MIGTSLAISIRLGAVLTVVAFRVLYAPYRRHSAAMDTLALPASVKHTYATEKLSLTSPARQVRTYRTAG